MKIELIEKLLVRNIHLLSLMFLINYSANIFQQNLKHDSSH